MVFNAVTLGVLLTAIVFREPPNRESECPRPVS
uniref:Photosystem II protein T n=2 Tax=Boodlea composita TaxID=204414 RepID=A0A2H4UXV7_9CHLO|nr:photosystem II protein T [Boodlea composita]